MVFPKSHIFSEYVHSGQIEREKYKLSKEQIDKANIYNYIGYKITLLTVPLVPNFNSGKGYDDKKFWFDLIDNLKFLSNWHDASGNVFNDISLKQFIIDETSYLFSNTSIYKFQIQRGLYIW